MTHLQRIVMSRPPALLPQRVVVNSNRSSLHEFTPTLRQRRQGALLWQLHLDGLPRSGCGKGITSFPPITLLWNISHPFQSIIEAGPDLASARQKMIEKLLADPGSFITKITPAEPSAKNIFDLGKQVFGFK